MLSILGFLVALGPLVIFHEFGHYFFARLFGVKAEVFSVGFGPRIYGRKIGETDFRLAAIPLGGFVKLLGEDGERELTPEEKKRSLNAQAPWKRFFIFLGGPLFNFILSALLFMAILAIGEGQVASVIGRVVKNSAAERAGFVSGDHIVSVDGQPVRKFDDVLQKINDTPNRVVKFEVTRASSPQPITVEVTPTEQDGFSVYGEATHVGEIEGLLPMARATQVGVSNPQSPAGKAGVKSGDRVLAVNGQAVKTWEEIERVFAAAAPSSEVVFTVEHGKEGSSSANKIDVKTFKLTGVTSVGAVSGLRSSELFVEKPIAKSPAEGAGIHTGDRLVSIGKQDVESFFQLKDAVQRAGEKDGKVVVTYEREGKLTTVSIDPTATNGRDVVLRKTVQYTIGVMPMLVYAEPEQVIERILNPFMLVYKGTERMVEFTRRNFISIGKMVHGDVSVATLGGPILIGKIAGESLSRGLIAFLTTMSILSIGLGVLNILPIPVLDGGHLALLVIEAVRGKPLTIRQTEIIQQVGLSLILALMVVVIRNDLARLPFFE